MYSYDLYQDGIVVASVVAFDEEMAWREICHYAMVYGEDGPVAIVSVPDVERDKEG